MMIIAIINDEYDHDKDKTDVDGEEEDNDDDDDDDNQDYHFESHVALSFTPITNLLLCE